MLMCITSSIHIYRRPSHVAIHRYLRDNWRDQKSVSFFQMMRGRANAFQYQVVNINVFQKPAAAIVTYYAKRAVRGWPSGNEKSIQRRRESANVISSRPRDVADNIHAHSA